MRVIVSPLLHKFHQPSNVLGLVINKASSVLPHFFADDTQLSGSLNPGKVTAVCRVLKYCVNDIQVWYSGRRLQLNPDKSELMLFGSQVNMERLASTDVSVRVGQTVIQPSDRVRDLGVILDSSLSMRQYIAKVAILFLSSSETT